MQVGGGWEVVGGREEEDDEASASSSGVDEWMPQPAPRLQRCNRQEQGRRAALGFVGPLMR